MPDTPPPVQLMPPAEGVFETFDNLMESIRSTAKQQGYGIVKLRASNYRDGKPTRYDLVCDRGGVKYNSTAKKRNPSTRKIGCLFRAKAVCEVQLGNQWRFTLQEGRHNHKPRVLACSVLPSQEDLPLIAFIQSFIFQLKHVNSEMAQCLTLVTQRLDDIQGQIDLLNKIQEQVDRLEAHVRDCAMRFQVIRGNYMVGREMEDFGTRFLASEVL
ncbi:hypothetical protein FSARC_11922 [Fusarium sarcochroum]|uniref:FAR1 domain-containing protein n=1 Tax=Fusarium sarcochroum TaxID=1208366 RepID=A0A8H4WYJ2_9HYPO|nr:hypothetical protein FSARC_11922 [Fusarium sarcochroum]